MAMIGVSRNKDDYTRGLMRELLGRGVEVIPVNPKAEEIEGRRSYAALQDIQPPVESVMLMTGQEAMPAAVEEILRVGARRVWIGGEGGPGLEGEKAARALQAGGVEVVSGYCMFMFLPGAAFFHRFHGFFKKVTGGLPA
jgi:predicted CoA-binding protein